MNDGVLPNLTAHCETLSRVCYVEMLVSLQHAHRTSEQLAPLLCGRSVAKAASDHR